MSVLDDPARIAAADPGGMLAQIAGLGGQLRRGFETGRTERRVPSAQGLKSIAICGMGGSGVAGRVIRSATAGAHGLPIEVVNGYALPESFDQNSLVFAVSFSGNTEETLATYSEAVRRGCRVVAVSAGGDLAARAAADAVPHVPVSGDVPMPRAALGDLVATLCGVLERMGAGMAFAKEISATAEMLDLLADGLGPERPSSDNKAKAIAEWIGDRLPVVWGSEGVGETAAVRWKTQMNENAKVPAFHSSLPELDHNEVEGWSSERGSGFALLILRHRREHARVAARVEATLAAIAGSGLESRQVWAEASTSALATLFGLVMVGDFTSTYLAIRRGVDPTPVPVLMRLKETLGR